jgi:trehalose 6-phosphate phosphatase
MTRIEESPPNVMGDARPLVERLESADGFIVGFDYDGTLAPIREDPDAPTIPPRLERALQSLADRDGVQVAVVSGRQLDDLADRVDVDGVVLAGNHGLELSRDGEPVLRDGVDRYLPSVRDAHSELQSSVADVPGCHVEDKGVTITVHVRETPADRVTDVRDRVLDTAASTPGVHVTEGKQVFEVRPSVPHDKGTTMELLEGENPSDWLTLYLGDDTTDEDAFAAIQPDGVGIHVGTGDTVAAYRLPEQGAVPEFVAWLATQPWEASR